MTRWRHHNTMVQRQGVGMGCDSAEHLCTIIPGPYTAQEVGAVANQAAVKK